MKTAMQPAFSSYLDGVRFLAALVVFLGHAAGVHWTGGLLWELGAYGDTCVVIFFILSGYVIAYVAETKESRWQVYGANRVARLWSVVIPALALTMAIDAAGVRIAPELYLGQPWFNGDHMTLRYLASLLMLQEAWHVDLTPGINLPFWSLSYEAFYYLLFAVLMFAPARKRFWMAALVLLAGGPLVALLFPIWWLGVVAYRLRADRRLPAWLAAVLCVGGAVFLVLSPTLRSAVGLRVMDGEVGGRYADAIAFFLHLLGVQRLLQAPLALPSWMAHAIRRIAASTFVLYLFHRPLIQLFSYVGPSEPASWARRALVIGGTLAVVACATPLCDRLQRFLRARCLRLFGDGAVGKPVAARSAGI